MIKKKETLEVVVHENMRGGNGRIEQRLFLTEQEAGGAGRLFCEMTIAPGNSIGRHEHKGENETFYIIEGKAKLTDADGSEHILGPGDAQHCADGEGHSVENVGDGPLRLIALILYTK
ncbi:MAG: cupin domain-containing protein [Clostridiales Family XIII bacterium]|jgi:quercetin dioxygenase-like cupin family protein|nr:cupin domain-containing protein [Clostridiales Family XIII bacterium]